MTSTNQSLSFTQGGQTQIHKLRMLKQVCGSTFKISFFFGFLVFVLYYLSTNFWMTILMYPFYALAEIMQMTKIILPHLQGFTFCVDIGAKDIFKCTDSYFLSHPYPYQLIKYLNQTMIQGGIYGLCSAGYAFLEKV